MNYRDLKDEKIEAHRKDGRVHVRLAARLYRKQVRSGRYFLHEHPTGATRWKEPSTRAIRHLLEVGTSKCDQCMCGCKTHSTFNDLEHVATVKPTRFTTNAQAMSETTAW